MASERRATWWAAVLLAFGLAAGGGLYVLTGDETAADVPSTVDFESIAGKKPEMPAGARPVWWLADPVELAVARAGDGPVTWNWHSPPMESEHEGVPCWMVTAEVAIGGEDFVFDLRFLTDDEGLISQVLPMSKIRRAP